MPSQIIELHAPNKVTQVGVRDAECDCSAIVRIPAKVNIAKSEW